MYMYTHETSINFFWYCHYLFPHISILLKNWSFNWFFFHLTAEEDLEFVRKLEDIDVKEIPGTALFECEVNKVSTVAEWFFNNQPLTASDKYEMESKGVIHRLKVKDVDGRDEGDYKVAVRGKTSEAGLFVEGVYFVIC